MTWILGSGVPFGYGALISDVRVSWPNGRIFDGLQKIHPIGAGLIAGFAGSVAVGFRMIDLMQRQWATEVGSLHYVKRMAWHWHRFARWYYRNAIRQEFRQLGCQLLIAGVSPEQHAFGFHSHAVSMTSPEFAPQIIKPWTWGSIGSGSRHAAAPDFQRIDTFWNLYAQGEIGHPGGAAYTAAHCVADDLERAPMASVSPMMQVAVVRANSLEVKSLRRQHRGAWTVQHEEDAQPGEFLTTWDDFRQAVEAHGLDAQGAVT